MVFSGDKLLVDLPSNANRSNEVPLYTAATSFKECNSVKFIAFFNKVECGDETGASHLNVVGHIKIGPWITLPRLQAASHHIEVVVFFDGAHGACNILNDTLEDKKLHEEVRSSWWPVPRLDQTSQLFLCLDLISS